MRHTVETVKIVRVNKYSDGVNSDYPIQLEYTGGGPDHNTTLQTVKIAHVLKFVMLDLDPLVAAQDSTSIELCKHGRMKYVTVELSTTELCFC